MPLPRVSAVRPVAVLLLFLIMLVSGPAARAQSNVLPSPRQLRPAGLELAWWSVATISPGRDVVTGLDADETTVFVRTRSNLITAIDLATGTKKWSTRLGRERQLGVAVSSSETLALVVVGRTAYALDKDTGQQAWELPLASSPTAPPAIDDTRLYVGTADGGVYAYDLEKIREFYSEGKLPQFVQGTLLWRYSSGASIVGPPVRDGIAVLFANVDGTLFALEAEEREMLWQFETDRGASAPVVAADGTAYVASEDRNLYAVDVTNGLDRWEFVSRSPIDVKPALVNDSLFVTPAQAGVSRVDRATGRPRWRSDRTTGFLAVAGGRVYASDSAQNVVALDYETGRPLGAALLTDYTVRTGNDRTDRVIVATPSGVVLCLKAAGSSFPIFHRNPGNRPVEPTFADPADAEVPAADPAADGRE